MGRAAWESRVYRRSFWVLAGKTYEEKLILKFPKGEEILKAKPLLQETQLWTLSLDLCHQDAVHGESLSLSGYLEDEPNTIKRT